MDELYNFGIRRNSRVAIVMPNGPELAVLFLSVSQAGIAAPLNPNYRLKELKFYLSDLKADAIVAMQDDQSDIVQAAADENIPIIRLIPDLEGPAGSFRLSGVQSPNNLPRSKIEDTDIALLLHTSGTTSRPKLVPLCHKHLCASAKNISEFLDLNPNDVCLNVMPLFHIHGLVAAILSSLCSGASVACSPGFNALQFFSWLAEIRPSWYTAVPTMHQAILGRANRNKQTLKSCSLRFIRSSSSALPVSVMEELEKVFLVPVIESYGMTEAAHQMSSNPLPPRKRKPGSVGIAAGPDIAIMDSDGILMKTGLIGEIVIRGENVIEGYEGNEEANRKSFSGDWFRTGDQGKIDSEGYIIVTGRLKEIINRGGEKISPREVDEILSSHPLIAQAIAFAIPHPKLGEDIAAAVVLNNNIEVDMEEIKKFLVDRLAKFKVPKTIIVIDEFPKGATGKIQRIGLAEKLGLVE